MTDSVTSKPPKCRHESRPAPGFEVLEDEETYVVTYEDIEAYPELDGVVTIKRATFRTYTLTTGESYYTSTYEAVVNLERWDTDNGSSCPFCGSVQATHTKGHNGFNSSFERLVCNGCDKEIYKHLRT